MKSPNGHFSSSVALEDAANSGDKAARQLIEARIEAERHSRNLLIVCAIIWAATILLVCFR